MKSSKSISIFTSDFSKYSKSNFYMLIFISVLLTSIVIDINYSKISICETPLIKVCPYINTLYAVILCPIIIIITQIIIYYFNCKRKEDKSEILELAMTIHDLKNSLFSVAGYAEVGNTEKVKEKVYEICDKLNSTDLITSENMLSISINKLIDTKKSIADKLHIEFNHKVDEIQYSPIKINDFCVLVGNTLDNAIEACKKICKINDRFINLEIRQLKDKMEIIVENSIISPENINMQTTKSNKIIHGYGLKSINKILNEYNGKIKNNIENNIFIVEINIPII